MSRSDARVAGEGRFHDTDRPDLQTASDVYARRFAGRGGRYLLDRQRRAVGHALRRVGSAPLRILDVGGAHAQLTEVLIGRGYHVTVHGSDPRCFAWSRTAALEGAGRVERCVSSLWRLPFGDGSFEMVAAFRLLAHVTEWRGLLAEMARVTSRYMLLEFPVEVGMQRLANRMFGMKKTLERSTRPFFLYPPGEVLRYLETLGFARLSQEGQFLLLVAAHRLIAVPPLSRLAEGVLALGGVAPGSRSPVVLLVEKASPVAASGRSAAAPHETREVVT